MKHVRIAVWRKTLDALLTGTLRFGMVFGSCLCVPPSRRCMRVRRNRRIHSQPNQSNRHPSIEPGRRLHRHASQSQPTHITPEQAQQLFSSVDAIMQFDSRVTGLPILIPSNAAS